MVAIGQDFRFSLDVSLSPTPLLNTESNSLLFNYLRDVSTDSTFALNILKGLIEERRTVHRDRQNRGKLQCSLEIGDVVKASVQVQSCADAVIVGKLSYRVKEERDVL